MVPEARSLVAASLVVALALAVPAAADPMASAYVGGKLPPNAARLDNRFCWAASEEGVNQSSEACWKDASVSTWSPGHVARVGELVVGAVLLGEEVCYMVGEDGSVQECTAFCEVLGLKTPLPWCHEPRLAPGVLP